MPKHNWIVIIEKIKEVPNCPALFGTNGLIWDSSLHDVISQFAAAAHPSFPILLVSAEDCGWLCGAPHLEDPLVVEILLPQVLTVATLLLVVQPVPPAQHERGPVEGGQFGCHFCGPLSLSHFILKHTSSQLEVELISILLILFYFTSQLKNSP